MNTYALNTQFANDVTRNYKKLSKDEEFRLIRLAKEGCDISQNKLINSQVPAIINIAKAYLPSNPRNEIGDLVGNGVLGLLRAIEKFDESYGNRLYSFAQRIIADEIRNSSVDDNTVRNSRGRSRSYAIDSKDLHKYDESQVEMVNGKWRKKAEIFHTTSFSKPVDSENASCTVGDMMADETAQTDACLYANDVERILSHLDTEDRTLLEKVHGIGGYDQMSLSDIGRESGTSRQVMHLKMKQVMYKVRKEFVEEV